MRTTLRGVDWLATGTIIAAVGGVAGVGARFAAPSQDWYRRLHKPPWQPPAAAFGPVWSVLYLLAATSAIAAWHTAPPQQRRSLFALYAANGALNAAWTAIFFRARRPAAATADSAALLVSTIALIARTRGHSRTAAATLVPYAAWVAFATALSGEIARRN
jgi:tryptophan-rich sensory protein